MYTSKPIIVHTKLYSEDAYQIIAAVKKARYYDFQILSLDTQKIHKFSRTRVGNNGLNYQIVRMPNGEVVIFHNASFYKNSDSVTTIKGELRSFISAIESSSIGENEKFLFLPFRLTESRSEFVNYEYLKQRLKETLLSTKRFNTSPRNFVYEKLDLDYIYSHPFTLKRLREAYEQIGKTPKNDEDGELDPILAESRKMIMKAFIDLNSYITTHSAITHDENSSVLRLLTSRFGEIIDEAGTAVNYQFMPILPLAIEIGGIEEKVDKFIDDLGTSVTFSNMYLFINKKDQMKASIREQLFDTVEYKEFLSALAMVTPNEPKFPTPSLICNMWQTYKELLD